MTRAEPASLTDLLRGRGLTVQSWAWIRTPLAAHALNVARDIAALPPESVTAARRLMRGSVEEIVARIDAEADAFKARLASPEAQKALATFLSRKR